MKDHYQTLGVPYNASPEAIRQAYRGLALRYHPDRNAEADAAQQFVRINEAYEILGDPARRTAYTLQYYAYQAQLQSLQARRNSGPKATNTTPGGPTMPKASRQTFASQRPNTQTPRTGGPFATPRPSPETMPLTLSRVLGYVRAGLLNILWLYCWTWIGKLVGLAVLRAFGVQEVERFYFPFALGALLFALYYILRTIAENYDGSIDQPRPPNPFRHFWRSHLHPNPAAHEFERSQAPDSAHTPAASGSRVHMPSPKPPEAEPKPPPKPAHWHPFSPK